MVYPAGELQDFSIYHWLANCIIALFYCVTFIYLTITLVKKTSVRDALTLLMSPFLLLLGVLFWMAAFSWKVFAWQSIVLSLIGLVAVIFFVSRWPASLFGKENLGDSSERFNKLKDEFLSVASHELRTPLSVINGFAEILVRERIGPLNDEQKRRIRKILMQGQRLNRIVDELLDLSRIRSGKVEVKKEIFDLVPVLKACLDDHQVVCEQQKLELKDEIPDWLPDVEGDLERVMQVVVNLCNNAIKYTEPGGEIWVTAYAVGRHIRIQVKDTGIGIPLEEQKHLYEEFFRVNHQYARKYSGSGLGLAIVKQLVEAQGGVVGMESPGVGKGSTFFFTIPIAKKVQVKKPQDTSASQVEPGVLKRAG